MVGHGSPERALTWFEVENVLRDAASRADVDGKRVLVIVPDLTRHAPIPEMAALLRRSFSRAAVIDFLVALGTHRALSAAEMTRLLGVSGRQMAASAPPGRAFNHEWHRPGTLIDIGVITATEVRRISDGLLDQPVRVEINRLILDYDLLIICGPVLPHEVVGFSGGNKYLFPGVSGPDMIDLSHWLGALITSRSIIGRIGMTPVRRLIDRAAAMVPTPRLCIAMVTLPGGDGSLAGVWVGTPEEAWGHAARLAAQVHITYVERPFRRVISVISERYDDIWTGSKGMYKVEPVVEDGGEVVIYAPHIQEFSRSHGPDLARVGYHVRDYFLKRWDEYRHVPTRVLAHSTHLKGAGTYDPAVGENPRITVTLATGISEARCLEHNLGYLDPASVRLRDWIDHPGKDMLVVREAGEMLYRLRSEQPPPEGREPVEDAVATRG